MGLFSKKPTAHKVNRPLYRYEIFVPSGTIVLEEKVNDTCFISERNGVVAVDDYRDGKIAHTVYKNTPYIKSIYSYYESEEFY